MANKIRSLLGGGGFYAVLALCVVAVGVGGYFLLLREEPQQEVPAETPDVQAAAPAELPEHEPWWRPSPWRSRRRRASRPPCRR